MSGMSPWLPVWLVVIVALLTSLSGCTSQLEKGYVVRTTLPVNGEVIFEN